jgi:hypothetical protein
MAIGEFYQVIIEQQLHAQTVLNVLYYEQIAGIDGHESLLAQGIRLDVLPSMKAVQSNELTHVAVYAQKIWPLPPKVAFRDATAAGPGGVAQNSLPTSMAVTITKKTAFAGRKFRGRLFIAGVPVTHELDSQLAVANLAAWQAFADKLLVNLPSTGPEFSHRLYHKATHTVDTVLSCPVRLILRNQRRRQIGKGR